MTEDLILVTGAGGFIGGHLAADLVRQGFRVRAVDKKPLHDWWQRLSGVEELSLDLNDPVACHQAVAGVKVVYNLAADMGGMGFIEHNKAACMLSVLTSTNVLAASREAGVERLFYSSSACVYAADKQTNPEVTALRESDAYPAMPEDGYGWEKLFSERMCRHFMEDYGIQTRVARYHNVYGPQGTWKGGREKAPAAVCRKVAMAKISGNHTIEIWGDGKQTRSFTFIDDCIKGTQAILHSNIRVPINLGSSELVTINQLVDLVENIAGIKLKRNYNLGAPKGVNGRNSDNTLIREYLNWAPSTRLQDGLEKLFAWVYDQIITDAPCPAY